MPLSGRLICELGQWLADWPASCLSLTLHFTDAFIHQTRKTLYPAIENGLGQQSSSQLTEQQRLGVCGGDQVNCCVCPPSIALIESQSIKIIKQSENQSMARRAIWPVDPQSNATLIYRKVNQFLLLSSRRPSPIGCWTQNKLRVKTKRRMLK